MDVQTIVDTPTKIMLEGPVSMLSLPVDTPTKIMLEGPVSMLSLPEHGTIIRGAADNIVTYTPNAGFSGTDKFTYRAIDRQKSESEIATVIITISKPGSLNPKRTFHLGRPFAPEPQWYGINEIKEHEISKDMQSYLDKRVRPFTENAFRKANQLITTFYAMQTLVIVVGALIPIINAVDPSYLGSNGSIAIRIISAILGSVVAASVGYIQLIKLLEAGIVSRMIMARLQREYHSFMLKADNYLDKNDDERNIKFVNTVENTLLGATSEYYELYRQATPHQGQPTPHQGDNIKDGNN